MPEYHPLLIFISALFLTLFLLVNFQLYFCWEIPLNFSFPPKPYSNLAQFYQWSLIISFSEEAVSWPVYFSIFISEVEHFLLLYERRELILNSSHLFSIRFRHWKGPSKYCLHQIYLSMPVWLWALHFKRKPNQQYPRIYGFPCLCQPISPDRQSQT